MKATFFAIFLLMVTGIVAQETQPLLLFDTEEIPTAFSKEFFTQETLFSFQQASQSKLIPTNKVSGIPSLDYLPSLFCKLEYQLESKSKLAPRFRLGSLQYTDWMEGKGEFYSRYYK